MTGIHVCSLLQHVQGEQYVDASLYPEHVHSCGRARLGWLLAVADQYVWPTVGLGFSIHCTCMCH